LVKLDSEIILKHLYQTLEFNVVNYFPKT